MRFKGHSGFTLIELLIVIAIILILISIALPNFLEAQLRAKVTRMKADMQAMHTAIESYQVDYRNYPCSAVDLYTCKRKCQYGVYTTGDGLRVITTPVRYIVRVPVDIFNPCEDLSCFPGEKSLLWTTKPACKGTPDWNMVPNNGWGIGSQGPNQVWDFAFGPGYQVDAMYVYSPTNGTVSVGDVLAYGP
ncbi:MAG: prepilin-type N-terminal cleavage/methylation domain-containing protein [Candidatus Omnitrophica bacterium]|nr:prepilin-type N-terminal cleavage/methylation domain-containing protein [bacterium]MBK7495244.1 prepilin-type N-terminal cleavage/methylation domain-containing protein [Candidatus Omnitrophota bacterium]MCE7909933.1 prepilin-type N-terminal cleavage/methylation domain-containing protein [Candidatus Omnitrophica bacterium COP1]MCC6734263.1 prepilin-type N-terminal cleavage/methylation domain-containing protein [Candidatus Omnitrophota bacterium]MCL4735840.1 prepilin-type N-terminal cleavage/m